MSEIADTRIFSNFRGFKTKFEHFLSMNQGTIWVHFFLKKKPEAEKLKLRSLSGLSILPRFFNRIRLYILEQGLLC